MAAQRILGQLGSEKSFDERERLTPESHDVPRHRPPHRSRRDRHLAGDVEDRAYHPPVPDPPFHGPTISFVTQPP